LLLPKVIELEIVSSCSLLCNLESEVFSIGFQGRHLGEGLEGVYGPQGFIILIFPCKSYLWNTVTAAETIHYIL